MGVREGKSEVRVGIERGDDENDDEVVEEDGNVDRVQFDWRDASDTVGWAEMRDGGRSIDLKAEESK